MNSDDNELVAEMSGHSGCRVFLYRRDEAYFVRKLSASVDYNSRLDQQRTKQQQLSRLVNTPDVLNHGHIDDLAYFDMAYVRGFDFKTFAGVQSVASLSDLGHRILLPLKLLSATADGAIPPAKFTTKIASVTLAVRDSRFFAAHAATLSPMLDLLAGADWSGIPATRCHGDLTLENLIITEEREIVMIDLLDGDLESVWMDAAKLLHDLDSGWSLRSLLWRRQLSSSDRLISMLTRYLYEEMRGELFGMFDGLSAKLLQLRVLQAARVLPYVTDEHVFWHAVRGIDKLFQQEIR